MIVNIFQLILIRTNNVYIVILNYLCSQGAKNQVVEAEVGAETMKGIRKRVGVL